MSSIRKLKKEVGDITYEVVSDCFTFMLVKDGKDNEKVQGYIAEAINLRNDLIQRINGYINEKDTKKRKEYFNKIKEDLYKGMDKTLEKLSKLSKK
jgi:hypothetical protein